MFERSISPSDVRAVVIFGEIIAEYLEDTPHPIYLTLGFVNDRPIHAVVA